MKKLIVYFHSSATAPSQKKVAGVSRAARLRGWSLMCFDIRSPEQIKADLRYWRPDGCIVDAVKAGTDVIGCSAFAKQPTVFIDCDPALVSQRMNAIVQDSAAIGGAAAEEMLRHSLNSYAYVSWPGRPFWSEERGSAFVKAIERRSSSCVHVFSKRHAFKDRGSLVKSLSEWLRTLQVPAGVFAATDAMSEHVLEAAELLGLSVPEDMMIIGTDNDELICENTRPMLSSVSQDFMKAGERAVEIVEELLSDQSRAPVRETFRNTRIVSRASTRRTQKHDHAVTEALDLIHERALYGITAAEALGCFTCSRRLAERRFRSTVGHSAIEEIHSVQIEHAKGLASNPAIKLTLIPHMCGHQSAPYFQRLFKRLVGCTMKEYRRRC